MPTSSASSLAKRSIFLRTSLPKSTRILPRSAAGVTLQHFSNACVAFVTAASISLLFPEAISVIIFQSDGFANSNFSRLSGGRHSPAIKQQDGSNGNGGSDIFYNSIWKFGNFGTASINFFVYVF